VQKSNIHYAQQPYTNQSVFKSLLNCASEMSLSRNATGREFQRHGPATEKLLSPRCIRDSVPLCYLFISIGVTRILWWGGKRVEGSGTVYPLSLFFRFIPICHNIHITCNFFRWRTFHHVPWLRHWLAVISTTVKLCCYKSDLCKWCLYLQLQAGGRRKRPNLGLVCCV